MMVLDRAERERLLLAALPALSVTARRLYGLPHVRCWLGDYHDVLQEAIMIAWADGFLCLPWMPDSWTTWLCYMARRKIVVQSNRGCKIRRTREIGRYSDYTNGRVDHETIRQTDARLDVESLLRGLVLTPCDRKLLLRDGSIPELASTLGRSAAGLGFRHKMLLRRINDRLFRLRQAKREPTP